MSIKKCIISLLSVFLFSACALLQPPADGGNPPLQTQQKPPVAPPSSDPAAIIIPAGKVTVPFSINSSDPLLINTKIFGFNTGFMFGGDIQDLPEVQRLHRSISPVTLRFPGGTIANYYHPDKPGYGFREEEMGHMKDFSGYLRNQAFEKENYLEAFARLSKTTNTQVIYVANLLTGTIDENIRAIDRLQSHGLKVVGIELGNEFLLQRYRGNYPSVQVYIDQAKTFAAAFRKKYPGIPLAVVGSGEGEAIGSDAAKFTNLWNSTLAKETFYDAVVYHFYARTGACNKLGDEGKGLQEVFNCLLETTAIEHYNLVDLVMQNLIKTYGKNRKIWITEWNTAESPKYAGNTFIQAAMATEFMFNTIRFNSKNNNLVEYTHFHNYTGAGFANTLFSYNSKKLPTLNGDDIIGTNCSYYPFAFYKDILIDAKAALIPISYSYSVWLNDKVFNMQAYKGNNNKLYVFFVNKSGQNIQLENKQWTKADKARILQAQHLYSTTGQAGYSDKRPGEVSNVKYRDTKDAGLLIPAFSLGYFELAL
jgi:alpha-L-arabinofuranosidase